MKKLEVDWNAVQVDYVLGKSLNNLAEIYGISRSTIANHASRGKWMEARSRASAILGTGACGHVSKGMQLLFGSDAEKDPIEEITDRCLRIVKTGLDKIEVGMGAVNPADSATIRSFCASLKDLQAVAGAFCGLTRQEISVRIENIQRQRQMEENGGTGVVVIPAVQELEEVTEDG